ncbi:MAG: hypothetical protein FJY95_00740 [Candidatus Handelsmanbacteria bacterium]|nr:hypothetical protein [Candidatus Handelsmanbacteria bacterium]
MCAALIGAEIAFTRLFSFLLYYHYTFLVLSGAICGLGLGAVLGQRLKGARALSLLAFGQGAGLWLAAAFAAWVPRAGTAGLLGVAALPFALAGAFLSLIFRTHAGQSQRLYFWDLSGAALATLGIIPCLGWLGGVDAVLACGLLSALAGGLVAPSRRWGWAGAGLFLLAFLGQRGLELVQIDLKELGRAADKPMFKALSSATEPGRLVQTTWSAYARTDLVDRTGETGLNLYTDGGAGSYMFRFEGDFRRLFFLRQEAALFPYYFAPRGRALILGPGGGADVLYALMTGWERVDGAEINAAVVDLVRAHGEYNGHLYEFDNVEVRAEDGRHFAERSKGPYDLIALPLVYSSAAELAGYALQENYLFTGEAYRRYLELLNPGGRLALVVHDHTLMLRVVTTLAALWQDEGRPAAELLNHLLVINGTRGDPKSQEAYRPLLLVQKTPFSQKQLGQLLAVAGELDLQPYFALGHREGPALSPLRSAGLGAFIANHPSDLRPVTDGRPYFYGITTGVDRNLKYLLWGAGAATLLLAGLHLGHLPQMLGLRLRVFAACLGAGFMLVEIYLLQRFSLLLGQPLLALAVTLFALLLSSAAGSLAGSRVPALGGNRGLGIAAVMTGVVGLGLGWLQGEVITSALRLEAGGRILVSLALILPLGGMMGLCFPAALRLAGSAAPGQIPWMWGINGVSSVAGSALAVVVGMKWGTDWALYCGAGAYLLAGVALGLGGGRLSLPPLEGAVLSWKKTTVFLSLVALLWYGVFSSIAGAGASGPASAVRSAPPPVAPEVWPSALRE